MPHEEICRAPKQLDDAYLKICTKVYSDLLKNDKSIFKRGNANIWSAAIVWAVGGTNFLGDKSFEPYATLNDVCDFFNANSSTVGQKSRKIKEILDIDVFNPEYRLPDSKVGSVLDSMVMTDNGLIVSRDMLEDDLLNDNEGIDGIEVVEEDAFPEYYLVFFKPEKKVATALYYQLEYQLKKFLEKDEIYVKSGITENGILRFLFFGWWDTMEKIQAYSQNTDFIISDIYYSDNVESLENTEIK